MQLGAILPAQRTTARMAGLLYLLMMITAIFTEFYAHGQLIVHGDGLQTARNMVAYERLFRIGIASDLITFAGDVILVLALYVVLRPVNLNVALLAAFWRLAESSILAVIPLNDFAALLLLRGTDYLRAFNTQQLQALALFFLSVQAAGYRIGGLFFGLGSTMFNYLWLKSCYIPRGLAAWGMFSSLVPVIVTFAILVSPTFEAVYGPSRRARDGAPIVILEVALGVWLLVKGIKGNKVGSCSRFFSPITCDSLLTGAGF